MVWALLFSAAICWSLSVFGASVYLFLISEEHGWSISYISSAVTVFYLTGAIFSLIVGRLIDKYGPRHVVAFGGISLALGVVGMGHLHLEWQVQVSFLILGIGYACLGATAISTTLAPWFERHQGKAVSIALMGASVGGMFGVPLLMYLIETFGFTAATHILGVGTLVTVVPIALFVLRRHPRDHGLHPDGDLPEAAAAGTAILSSKVSSALSSFGFYSLIIGFSVASSMQLGFLTHHVSLMIPMLSIAAVSATVFTTGLAALCGRLAVSIFVDRVDLRTLSSGVLLIGAVAFSMLSLSPTPVGVVAGSVLYGLILGNVTSLPPIIVRREFGPAAYGTIFGIASTAIGISAAMGPVVWGLLRDLSGGYGPILMISAMVDVIAAIVILFGRGTPVRQDAKAN